MEKEMEKEIEREKGKEGAWGCVGIYDEFISGRWDLDNE